MSMNASVAVQVGTVVSLNGQNYIATPRGFERQPDEVEKLIIHWELQLGWKTSGSAHDTRLAEFRDSLRKLRLSLVRDGAEGAA